MNLYILIFLVFFHMFFQVLFHFSYLSIVIFQNLRHTEQIFQKRISLDSDSSGTIDIRCVKYVVS